MVITNQCLSGEVIILHLLIYVDYILQYVYFRLRDWTHREAYLDLDRRERKGQPAIDPYFVSPETVRLPTEAEIGDREIII